MSHVFRRGQLKASVTKLQTFIDEFIDTPLNQARLQQRINNLKDMFKVLPELTEKLFELDPQFQQGDHGEIENDMMEKYMDVLAAAELKKPVNPEAHGVERASTSTNSIPPGRSNSSNVDHTLTRMPKLELRKFDGRLEEWKSFSHWFIYTIHNREGLTDSMRLSYLQDTLTGEAAKTIAGLEATNEHYKEAWELLEATYNNEEAIISRHFELLVAIPKLQNASGDALRQLINETLVHVRGMKVLGEPTDQWDTPLLHHTISKLDYATKREWYRRKTGTKRRTFEELITFLREEAMKTQTVTCNKETKPNPIKFNNKPEATKGEKTYQKFRQVLTTMVFKNCPICNQDGHATYRCKKLLEMSVPQRINTVKIANLCFNCLRGNHQTNDCRKGNCFKCGKVHHTILHLNKANSKEEEHNIEQLGSVSNPRTNSIVLLNRGRVEELMVTAMINILNKDNQPIRCRTLLDTAATSNLITDRFANSLGLSKQRYSLSIGGLGDIQTSTSYKITATIQSRVKNYERKLDFFTVPAITRKHPTNRIERETIQLPLKLNLADPTFHVPGSIDMLIGAGPALATFISGQRDLSTSCGPDLFMQNTHLGWVIGGAIFVSNKHQNHKSEQTQNSCYLTTAQALQQLAKTWAIEEGPKTKHLSEEETACEIHYKTNVKRHSDGKYIVALPFNNKKSLLGETRARALNRLNTLEKRFKAKPEFKAKYSAVIQEYLDLDHMELATDNSLGSEGFYLPHHAVIKESSLTTKVRVVFDGSAKSSSGLSLNETQMVGPTIQDNIIAHLIRFRLHIIVVSGDIEKMYRQFWVRPRDRKYQKILWRDESGKIQDYQLKTITFGLSSSPFLAIRSLYQLADDEREQYPIAAKILKRDMYVDDLLSGADTVEEAIEIRDQVNQLLKGAGLNIRKWASNDPRILEGLAENNINERLQIEINPILKTLGIHWQSQADTIIYTLNSLPTEVTMRIILTEIAKIFDPLGLLGPIIIAARLILQDCWRQQVTWDQQLPLNIQSAWRSYATEFNEINEISYNRTLILPNTIDLQLHGFADASERAYGACVYLRCTTKSGDTQVRLLCAKTKIAPLHNLCLARLELCAALMLANLYEAVREIIHIQISKATFWSDSTIVLHWINTPTYQLKTFVANRVAEIQIKTQTSNWRHVRTADNPADASSRGQSPKNFVQNSVWNSGPTWLGQAESKWPTYIISPPSEDNEKRKGFCLTTCTQSNSLDDSFIINFKTISNLYRAVAYCLRFSPHNTYKGENTLEELRQAQTRIIRLVQAINFPKDLHDLKHKQNIQKNSKLKHLSPFIDDYGILRVGGRLAHANISYDQQHPILLPQSHPLTTLIIRDVHERHFHAGPQTTLYAVRRNFWPLNGRNEVKRITHRCIRCIKSNPRTSDYIMGELPKERVIQTRPFHHTGIDYCGPFFIKEKKHRNRGKVKVYVAVFVCLVVKAVHLEIVSELTSEGFIAALRRFIARRGKCNSIHSDNGTTFIGANHQLKEIYRQINSDEHQQRIHRYLANEGIEWKFIPAYSPNFGGLWEAAVKSFKHHMTRIVGESLLTFEELYTFVTEIEAILNSRPLTPSSSDPNDPIAITPGHFLIGDSMTSVPDWDWTNTPSNRLSSWQQIQKLKQAFWKRWHKEYINGLNVRHKWLKRSHSIKEGTMVIIKEDNTRPLCWPIGRVVKTHPGSDGVIRIVTLRTSKGIIDRNVRKLAVLLPNEE